jgi:hypothetical protein
MLKPSLNAVQDVVRAHADDTEDKRRLQAAEDHRADKQPDDAGAEQRSQLVPRQPERGRHPRRGQAHLRSR